MYFAATSISIETTAARTSAVGATAASHLVLHRLSLVEALQIVLEAGQLESQNVHLLGERIRLVDLLARLLVCFFVTQVNKTQKEERQNALLVHTGWGGEGRRRRRR